MQQLLLRLHHHGLEPPQCRPGEGLPLLKTSNDWSPPQAPSNSHARTLFPSLLYLKLAPATSWKKRKKKRENERKKQGKKKEEKGKTNQNHHQQQQQRTQNKTKQNKQTKNASWWRLCWEFRASNKENKEKQHVYSNSSTSVGRFCLPAT